MGAVLGRLFAIFDVIFDMVILTLCFLLGVVAGAVVLGVAPAFEALLCASSERYLRSSGVGAWRLFWTHWRMCFVSANRHLLVPITIIAFLLYDYALLQANLPSQMWTPVLTLIGILVAWGALALIHGARDQLAGRPVTFIDAALVACSRPWHNLAFATITFALARIALLVNGFWLLLLWGAWGWGITVIGARLDTRYMTR